MPNRLGKSNADSKSSWFNNLLRGHRHLPNAPNSTPSSPSITTVPEGNISAASGVLGLTNIQNDGHESLKSNDGLQASDSARRSNPSQPQGLADSTTAQPENSTSPQAQLSPSSTQAPNDTGGNIQSMKARDDIESVTDVDQNPSPDEDPETPDLQWDELWTRAHNKLRAYDPGLINEYKSNLAKLRGVQSSGQSEGFTIDRESVGSIVARLDKERGDKQWCLKWKTDCFTLDINIRKQVEKLVKVAIWSDRLVKEALTTQPHAALAWCAATMVLPFIGDLMSQHEDMLKGFNDIAEIQVYWKACELVCLQRSDVHLFQDLMSQLITLYSQVLEYQARVVNHLSEKTRSRAKDALTGQHDWKALAKSIANLHSEMSDKPVTLVHRGIIYNNWQEQLKKMDDSNKFLDQIQQLTQESFSILKTAQENELLKTLSPTPYEEALSDVRDLVRGTCEWFFNSPGFMKWRDMETSGILWISALPGCGKSVLAKFLIKESRLSNNMPLTTTIAHFFFKDGERTSKTRAMCALLWQLLINDPTGKLIPHAMGLRNATGNDSLRDNFEMLWKLLEYCASSPACGDIIFVIDALDECSKGDRYHFITALQKFFSSAKATDRSTVKFLITSRPYDEFNLGSETSPLFKYTTHISFSEISKEEIELVVKAHMEDLVGRLPLDAHTKISDHFTNMEAHTYLGLDLTIKFIKEKRDLFQTPDDIDEQLRKLPSTTFGLYRKLLEINQDADTKKRSSRLLKIVYGAMRPLTLQEANYALKLALRPRTFVSHQSLKPMLFPEDSFPSNIQKWTGFMVDVHDGKLNFIHQTARAFLNPSSQGDEEEQDSNNQWYHTSGKDAHRLMFNICWEYLNSQDFDHGNKIFRRYRTTRSPEGTVERLVKADLHDLSLDYPFLQYARTEWLNHAIAGDLEPALLLRADLAKAPTLCDAWLLRAAEEGKNETVAQLCKQGANVDITHERHHSPLSLAAEQGHEAVVRLLVDTGKADIDSKDTYGRTPLSLAARQGHEAVVRLLVDTGKADIDSKDTYGGQTPLSWAASQGHEAVVRLLVDTGKADIDSKDAFNRTPLSWAAWQGHEAVVRLLVDTGKADIDWKDTIRGQTPLLWAARQGHEAVVQLLVDTGKADIDSKDIFKRTPLSWAAEKGQLAVVQLLVDTGKANIDSKDDTGLTPLSWAAEHGHEAVVRLLLEAKADINSKDGLGQTPLSFAAEQGHEAVGPAAA